MLLQTLSAKLGIATGQNLAELCRNHYNSWTSRFMWFIMEIVAMATDLAEFLGAALGFNLLLGVPMWLAGILTAIATFLILGLEKYGFRSLEVVISILIGVVAASYLIETWLDKPDWAKVFHHAIIPQFSGTESLILATGILGATVMPHAIYLHSALTQGRIVVRDPQRMKKLYRYEIADVTIAMGLAGLVNAAMLIMAAATFFDKGFSHVATIEDAHLTLQPVLGHAASWFFALSLLASGLSSASVGTMAGQVIMQGFLNFHIPIWIRRFVTMAPSLVVIALGFDPTRTLVLSQVVLSFGLPFAIIPLVYFTANKKIMGVLVNRTVTTLLVGIIAAIIILLNFYLLYDILF
jgi:manganese transport protein